MRVCAPAMSGRRPRSRRRTLVERRIGQGIREGGKHRFRTLGRPAQSVAEPVDADGRAGQFPRMTQIENISDTARWVAVYRAMETERQDAIFRDPFAARLAGEKGQAIVDTMKRGRQMAWAMIVRTAVFDEIIEAQIRAGVDQIVNLAAGLDARAWRMKLPAVASLDRRRPSGHSRLQARDDAWRDSGLPVRGDSRRSPRTGRARSAVLADRRAIPARARRHGGAAHLPHAGSGRRPRRRPASPVRASVRG